MSYYFEAAVVEADYSVLVQVLAELPRSENSGPRWPTNLSLHQLAKTRFVVFARRVNSSRPDSDIEVEHLAAVMSYNFCTAVAVHYNDQIGVRVALLCRNGKLMREFGEADEVWVPYGEDGDLIMDGPRYTGNALPLEEECDCISNGIDAAFEATGWSAWASTSTLRDIIANRDNPMWECVWEPK